MKNIEKIKNLQSIEHLAKQPLPNVEVKSLQFPLEIDRFLAKIRAEFALFENLVEKRAFYFEPLSSELRTFDVLSGVVQNFETELLFPRGSRLCATYFGLYLLGGQDSGISKNKVFEINPDGSHTEKAPMLESRTSH
jgi:hypothetical protein